MPETGHKFGRRLDLVLMQRVLEPADNTAREMSVSFRYDGYLEWMLWLM